MTVGELIEVLRSLPRDAEVLIARLNVQRLPVLDPVRSVSGGPLPDADAPVIIE